MDIEFFESQTNKNNNYDNYYKLEQPSYVLKITDFNNLNDDDDNMLNGETEEKKEYFELKPVEAPLVRRIAGCYDFQDDFRIEELISEKTILDYDHEIETSSYYDFSFDENSFDDSWEYFDLTNELRSSEIKKNVLNSSSKSNVINDDEDEELMMMSPYQCSKCGDRFQLSQNLFNHLQEFHQEEADYTCVICEQVFDSPLAITKHMRLHKDVKRPYACTECGKKFKTFEYLENHRQNKMCNSEQNICVVCGKEFKNQFNLVRHRTVHTNERPFKCSICGKMFKQQDNLNVHVRCHKSEKPFKCEKCPKTFRDHHYLVRHQKLHLSAEHLFACTLCPKRFRLELHLEKHMQIHNSPEKSFACPQCNKCYRTELKLSRHIEKHTTNNDTPQCRVCKKEFPNTSYLIRHMVIHKNEKTTNINANQQEATTILTTTIVASAGNSTMNFSDDSVTELNTSGSGAEANTYGVRVITEKDNRPFSCPYCDRRFRTAGYMRKHQRHIHPDVYVDDQTPCSNSGNAGGGGVGGRTGAGTLNDDSKLLGSASIEEEEDEVNLKAGDTVPSNDNNSNIISCEQPFVENM